MSEPGCNVFVARTPLQCFNAIEARDRFHSGERNHLLLCEGNRRDATMMRALAGEGWTSVKRLPFSGITKSFYTWRINAWLRSLVPVSYCYVGLVKHVPLHVLNTLQPAHVRILDDGNETLHIARWMREDVPAHHTPSLREQVLGQRLDPGLLQKATFFSAYDTAPWGYPCIPNDYRSFRARTSDLPVKDMLLFIGSNLIGNYLNDVRTLLRVLEQVRDANPELDCHYCPHRYESASVLHAVVALGYRLYVTDTILEAALSSSGWKPALVGSIRSTAVDTLALLYGVPGFLVEVPRSHVVSDARYAELALVWRTYREGGGIIRSLP